MRHVVWGNQVRVGYLVNALVCQMLVGVWSPLELGMFACECSKGTSSVHKIWDKAMVKISHVKE